MILHLPHQFLRQHALVEHRGGDDAPHFRYVLRILHRRLIEGHDVVVYSSIIVNFFHCACCHLESNPVVKGLTPDSFILHVGVPLSLRSCMRVRYTIAASNVLSVI